MTLRNALTQMKARSAEKGKYADGLGLWLFKSRKDAGKWILRIIVAGKRREMGLGRWPDVTISEARERAEEARRKVRDGDDPIEVRKAERRRQERLSLSEVVHDCYRAKQAELKGDGKAGRWLSPLSIHILPKIGDEAIEDVDQHLLRKVLEPIWHSKADTARKATNRVNLTLQHAAAMGLDVDLQAVMKVRALLGKQRHTVQHIPSIPYQEAPEFYRWLTTKDLISALALRFLMLTVARTSEVRFATTDEFEEDVWTLAPERTKTGREHRIPLSKETKDVLALAKQGSSNAFLFPTSRGKAMSDAAMSRFMEREGYEARPHGFRATFRTWVEETTDTPFEVKESVLGHQVDGETVRAYQRSDRLEKRAALMQSWADYLSV